MGVPETVGGEEGGTDHGGGGGRELNPNSGGSHSKFFHIYCRHFHCNLEPTLPPRSIASVSTFLLIGATQYGTRESVSCAIVFCVTKLRALTVNI